MTTIPSLQTIGSTLHNTTNDIRDTRIVDGIYAGDTLRIEFEDGRIFYATYDVYYPETLLWSECAYNADDEEEVVCDGGARDMSDGDVAALYYDLKNF